MISSLKYILTPDLQYIAAATVVRRDRFDWNERHEALGDACIAVTNP